MNIKINDRSIGPGHPVFFIAEIGINHNGSCDMALRLIDQAVEAGAEAVKFQKRDVPVVYSPEELSKPRQFDPSIIKNAMDRMKIEGIEYPVFPPENLKRLLGTEDPVTTNGDLKYALEFGRKEYDLINTHCKENGITWSASSWDGQSAHFINGFEDVAWLKIASACLTHVDLLQRVRAKKKPVIISTGGCTIGQIEKAIEVLGLEDLVILHCTAEYPPVDNHMNLRFMEVLRTMYPGVPIGYSSHSTDILPPITAVAMGACIIEAHLTLDRNLPGSDHKASLTPDQFKEMVDQSRRIEAMKGTGVKQVWDGERKIMEKLRRVDDLKV